MNKNRFIGTWKLQSFILKSSSGKTTYPFGENPVGYIMYNEAGYMSVAIMHADRPNFATDDWFGGTAEEKAKAFEGYLSYCGKYEIKASEAKVIHHPEVIIIPNQTNVPQERNFEFDGDKLILGASESLANGETQSSRLVWQKV